MGFVRKWNSGCIDQLWEKFTEKLTQNKVQTPTKPSMISSEHVQKHYKYSNNLAFRVGLAP